MVELRKLRESLAAGAIPHNTGRAYASDWRDFCGWCGEAGRAPLPALAESIELYLVYLAESRSLKVSTIQRRVWAIVRQHRGAGYECGVGETIWGVVAAIARRHGRAQRRVAALTPEQIAAIANAYCSVRLVDIRHRAVILLGFSTGLRCSSLAALQLADLDPVPRGLLVRVRREKQDQEGVGRTIGVLRGAGGATDVVSAVEAWLRVRGDAPGPLFGVCSRTVRAIVKSGCARAGIDPAEYSAHSLRSGMITALDAGGASLPSIMARSGHKSVQVAMRYMRSREAFACDPLALVGAYGSD